ncbi:MAG: hypothetical protein GY913_20125 [Proteobacteria bacterium]|nr:hypothetical protein [Pseudomonadota bacterium]
MSLTKEAALVALLFAALAVGSTWPLAADLDGQILMSSERFDGYGTIWLGEHVWRALTGDAQLLHAMEMNHPEGLDLRLADSFVYGLLFVPLRAVMPSVAAFNIYALISLAGTGLAGWWLARGPLGTRTLPALVCGIVVAFNAAMLNYRIEGEAYLLGSWCLPLLAGLLVLAGRGSVRAGAGAGACLAVLAWSSGYLAIDGAFIAAAIAPLSVLAGQRRGIALPALAFVVVALVLIAPLASMVGAGLENALDARFRADEAPLANITADSVSLSSMIAVLPETAFLRQGRLSYAGLAPLVLGAGALLVVPWRKWLPWAGVALAGLVLALGPYLRLTDADLGVGLTLPYAALAGLSESFTAYRMPIRFLAVSALGMGALLALFLDQLATVGVGRRLRIPIAAAVVLDCLVMNGFALERTLTPVEIPDGYERLSKRGAVFDLWGPDRQMLRHAGLSAFYQTAHGQPVVADFTRIESPQTMLGERLGVALAVGEQDDAHELLQVLAGLGVSDVALHADTFRSDDAAAIRARLRILATPTSRDPGGVEIYTLPERLEGMSQDEALAHIANWSDDA